MKPPSPAFAPAPASIRDRTVEGPCREANDVIALVGDKWSVHIVMLLGQGRRRFMDIKRSVDGISHKVLTSTLRGLERDGYVERTVHATVPPRVDYELTALGLELLGPLTVFGNWAIENRGRVLLARAEFDGAKAR